MEQNKKKNDFIVISNDGECAYIKDTKGNYYCLDYFYADKSMFRDYSGIEPTQSYIDEDGDVCYEYDDDDWDITNDIIEDYIKDYDKRCVVIMKDNFDFNTGDIFEVKKDSEWWYGLPISERLDEIGDIEVSGVCYDDSPKYTDAYISSAFIDDGYHYRELTDFELEELNDNYDFVYEQVMNHINGR
tara:strand:+ start:3548 stop:4108 length:561 start_codon:yes stop_codon:yes gene_type:complete